MPTPMAAYSEAAQRFGNVDPTNATAVEAFFVETFPQLGGQRQEEILAYLLSREGAPATTLKKRGSRDALDTIHRAITDTATQTTGKVAVFARRLLGSYGPVAVFPKQAGGG
jgi:hypothetical protein